MGFFSKIGKGIKKVFKKIGKAVKSGFKKFGKFMNKIGIVGQLAMFFILPGVGSALMKGLSGAFKGLVGATQAGTTAAAATSATAASAGTAASTAVGTGTATATQTATIKAGELATKSLAKQVGKGILKKSAEGVFTATRGTGLLGSSSGLLNGVGTVLQAAGNFVGTGVKAFSTVTEGISSFIGEFSKTALNKIPGVNIGSAAPTMGQAWKNVQNSVMKNASGTIQAFNTSIGIKPTAGATKFGTAGYTTPARVSVDSLQKASLQKQAATSGVKLLEADGGSLTLPAGTDLSKLKAGDISDIKARALGLGDDGIQMPTVDSTGALTDSAVGAQAYKVPETNSLLSKQPVSVNPQNDIISSEISEMKRKFDLKNAKIGTDVVTPTESTYERLQRTNSKTPTSADRAFKLKQIGTDVVTPASNPDVANLNFGEQIIENVSKLPGKIRQSILDFPTNIAKIPEQFVDNLTDTVTGLPNMAAKAALNRRPADQVTNNQVALGNIPESTYGINQSNIAESGIAVGGYQSKVNPSALYGTDTQAYNQFFKMLGPQPQQMRV